MKTFAESIPLAVAIASLFGGQAFAQPTSSTIDPLTGMPLATGSKVTNSAGGDLNPGTGMPQANGSGLPLEEQLRNQAERERLAGQAESTAASQPDLSVYQQAQALTQAGRHADALKRYLDWYAQAQSSGEDALSTPVLAGWADLGRKYPEARQALIDIRDKGASELEQAHGHARLLQEVAAINAALEDDAATVTLFKSLRQKSPSQAEAWYLHVEPALVRCGEYQLCLDGMGNPETRFNIYCYTFKRSYETAAFAAEHSNESRRRALESLQQPGRPPVPPFMLRGSRANEIALAAITNSFNGEISSLIEILVHTGHQEMAEKIRAEAAAVLGSLPPPPKMSGTKEPAGTTSGNGDWPPGGTWATRTASTGSNPVTGLPVAASSTPTIIAPSNQFFGPTLELTLKVNDNGLTDGLNPDYRTVVPLPDVKPEANLFDARLPENGIAIFPPHPIAPTILAPLKVVSKRTRFFRPPLPNDARAWDEATPPAWVSLPDEKLLVGLNLLYDRARADQLPALFGFQTSLGNAGLLEITGFTDHPRGVTVRYKLLQNPNPPEIPDPNASPEDWAPAKAPNGIPALVQFKLGIKKLMDQDRYAEVLERQVWYYNHALQCGDYEALRLSYICVYGGELVRRYPKAKQAMINIRDRTMREFSATDGDPATRFKEISVLNFIVHDEDGTVALFKTLGQTNPQLARECYGYVDFTLVQRGEYALCDKYLGDPQKRFDAICRLRQVFLHSTDNFPASFLEFEKRFIGSLNRQMGLEDSPLRNKSIAEHQKDAAHDLFVREARTLIEILVATGHGADAEKIRAEALLVVDDPGVRSAVTDAEQKLAK